MIDPGHGGHDTGTIGPNGLREKDLVLEVGRRLGKLLEARLGAEVVYTRKNDTFIPLETRTAIANQQRADLFISIHANSSHDPNARGVETYHLNFTSSPEALEVAARENAVSEKSIYELQDLVKKIALKEKIEESREFAADVQASLHSGLASKSSFDPQSRSEESTFHRPDWREYALDPGGNLLRFEPLGRTSTGDQRVPATHRRVPLPRNREVCRWPQRRQDGQQDRQNHWQ